MVVVTNLFVITDKEGMVLLLMYCVGAGDDT